MCQDICSKHVIITLTLQYQSDECCQQMKFSHKTDCSAHSQVLNLRATSSYEFIETLMPQEPCFHYLSGEFERHFKMFHKKDKDFWHLTTRDSTTWGSFFAQGLVFTDGLKQWPPSTGLLLCPRGHHLHFKPYYSSTDHYHVIKPVINNESTCANQ